ncbi:MAG: cupin domain-containing protein [Brevundimonas sp.]|jgi:transcriptional regulator with XRE-family HTH domain|uniref:cupin domain-containing protein n=1 Tax=Brevundimonas sp. TaxID=1871086 RepID=UPI0025C44F20|nr:cupin domain-containing protein [Brevundimonas sp.]MBX3476078.1 cupin domain-containing protein [Brevundimonas sp.]
MTVDVGSRLRFVRERQGLSQRELSKRAGVTNSTISLIEAGRMNPSIGALKRILDGIPVGLSEFFAIVPEASSRFFYTADELTEIGKGLISYRQVGERVFGKTLQILSETYQPGADTGRVPLMHEGQEGAVVISGRLEVTVEGRVRVLGPGDAYYFESHKPHRFRCVGQEPCRLISACTPPSF